ncbi:hypothetical protein WN944_015789 [Citrus x changshan-huyou]|uniref:Uncharacterized protein n=1 Tax=Citrus x changshan-huyou TaxID=2935761 RepID=A0AAP0MCH4_9ROSI
MSWSMSFILWNLPQRYNLCWPKSRSLGCVWDKHLNRQRDLAGSFENMSTMISKGKAAAIASTSC